MTHKHIDPIIREQLSAFRRRRQRLLLMRGGCAALVTLLLAMGLVAFLDWRFVLSDEVRIGLSVVAYALVLGMLWVECLRALLHRTSVRELARLIETGQPALREHLLSAVELGDYDAETIRDSEVFRKILQGGVSKRIADVDMRLLLSFRLIRRWVLTAMACLAIVLTLLLVPGTHVAHLLARALVPIANLARVSSTEVLIVEPSPADTVLAQGDVQAITVEVSDKRVRKVVLETKPARGGRKDRVGMSVLPSSRFFSNVKITSEPFLYRIYAGDAITRWYSIDSRPRPRVVKFHKRYAYPAYSRLQPRTLTEEHGDLTALEQTVVHLELELDQPVRDAALHLEIGEDVVDVTAQPHPTAANRVTARVPMTANGTYRTHLVATETGFENKFSPRYEIRIEPDLMPHVQLDKPERDLVLTANEMVRLEGVAHDDIGLARVAHSFRINKGRWQDIVISEDPVTDLQLARTWDLNTFNLKAGDKLYAKFTARDLKGSRSESTTLRILIGSSRFEADRFAGLEKKKSTLDKLETLNEKMSRLRKDVYDLTKDWEKKDESELEKRQKMLAAVEAAEDAKRQFEKAREQLKRDLAKSTAGQEASDLSLVAQMLSQAQHQALDQMQEAFADSDELLEEEELPTELKLAREATRIAESDTRKAADAFRNMLASEEAEAIAEDLRGLQEEQDALVKAAADPSREPEELQNLARKQEALADAMEPTSDAIEDLQEHVPNEIDQRTGQVQDLLDKGRERAKEELAEDASSPPVKEVAERMRATAQQALSRMEPIRQKLEQETEKSLNALAAAVDDPSEQLEDVRRAAEDHERHEQHMADRLEKTKNRQELERLAQQLEERKAKAEDLWSRAVEQLEDQAELEEVRPDTDPRFVKDLAQASRALEALRERPSEPTDSLEELKAVEDAVKALSAVHELEETSAGLERLAQDERWGAEPDQTREDAEQAWDWIEDDLKELPQDARDTLSSEVADALNNLKSQPEAKAIAEELRHRKNSAHQPEALHEEAQALNDALEEALSQAKPKIDESRAVLDDIAPSIGEQLAELAEQSKSMEEKADAAARKAAAAEADDASDSIREMATEEESFAEDLQQVKDDLRRDANVQDLASEEGRERARDDDTALAMLNDQPQGLREALEDTEAASNATEQQEALSALAAEQEDVTETLEQLAEHFEALEAGEPEETRTAMRDTERELGVHSTLEEQYDKARQLADLAAADTPREMLANLERELGENEAMQEALQELAGNVVDEAQETLAESVAREQGLSEELGRLAEQEPSASDELRNAVNELTDAAQELAGKDIPSVQQAAERTDVPTPSSLPQAAEQVGQRVDQVPDGMASSPADLAEGLDELAKPLREAQNALGEMSRQASALDELAQPLREAQAAVGETAQQAASRAPRQDATSAGLQALQEQAAQAAAESGQLAEQASELADAMTELAEAGDDQLDKASSAQSPIAEDVGEISEDLGRAARHNERLQEPYAGSLSELGEALDEIADSTIPAAAESLAAAETPAQGEPVVADIADALQAPLDHLTEISERLDSASTPSQPSDASAPQTASATWLARALDAADQAVYAQPPETAPTDAAQSQPGAPTPSELAAEAAAQAAVQAAAESQAASMTEARSPSMANSQSPNSEQERMAQLGAALDGTEADYEALGKVDLADGRDWAQLPPRLARELREARREAVSDEYRAMIETYFKVLAERNKK